MFIELTELITGGLSTGKERQISINTNRVISFTPVESGEGTNIEVKRGIVRVKQTYDEVKELIA